MNRRSALDLQFIASPFAKPRLDLSIRILDDRGPTSSPCSTKAIRRASRGTLTLALLRDLARCGLLFPKGKGSLSHLLFRYYSTWRGHLERSQLPPPFRLQSFLSLQTIRRLSTLLVTVLFLLGLLLFEIDIDTLPLLCWLELESLHYYPLLQLPCRTSLTIHPQQPSR